MNNYAKQYYPLLVFFVFVCTSQGSWAADGTIKFGISSSVSGSFGEVGEATKMAAELARSEINSQGGVKVGGKTYEITYEYVDNASTRGVASANALTLISHKQVLAIIGPQSSDRAIVVGEVANSFRTPMISPWSTAAATTLRRPYVFRTAAMIPLQSQALVKFVSQQWQATKAAVLYDEVSPYPSSFAKSFQENFEKANGAGSVVAFETFRTGDTDYSKQLSLIAKSSAEVLFVPQHDTEVPAIVRQARAAGWHKPIFGGNAWAGGDLGGTCGDDCKGLFFSGNFAAGGTTGSAKQFVDTYKQTYNTLPDEPAALTYDSVHILVQALEQMGSLSGNILADRQNLQRSIAKVKDFKGVTGSLTFDGNGDPEKCVAIIEVDGQGLLTTKETLCP